MKPTKLDKLLQQAEDEYFDNSGSLSIERRDYYFAKVVKYAGRLERQLKRLRNDTQNGKR